MATTRKDVRLVTLISPVMDDDLAMMAELQGLCKSDVVRHAIAQYISSYKLAVQFAKDKIADLTPEQIVKLREMDEKLAK